MLPRYKMTNSLNVKVTVYSSEMEQAQALTGLFVCLRWAAFSQPVQLNSSHLSVDQKMVHEERVRSKSWGGKAEPGKMQSLCQKAFYTDLTCLCWKRGESSASGPCSCQSHPKSDGEKQSWGMPRAAQTSPPARERGAKWGAGLHASTLKWHAFLIKEIWMEEQLAWAHFLHVFRLCKRNKWPKHSCLHL